MCLKLLQKKTIQKTAETNGDLIGNKIANKITGVWKNPQHNISETVIRKIDLKKYPKKDNYLQNEDKKLLMNWD